MIRNLSARNRVLVVVALLICAFVVWRLTRPPLSSEQQIRANMNDVTQAIRNTSPRGMLGYLAPDFKWNNMARDEAERLIREGSVSASRVELTRSNEQIVVRGETATVTGDFSLRYHLMQERREAPAHSVDGNYTVLWRKDNNDWKIAQIQGGQNAPNPATSDSLF